MASVVELALDTVADAGATVLSAAQDSVEVVGDALSGLVQTLSPETPAPSGGGKKKWVALLLVLLVVLGVVWWKRSSAPAAEENPNRAAA